MIATWLLAKTIASIIVGSAGITTHLALHRLKYQLDLVAFGGLEAGDGVVAGEAGAAEGVRVAAGGADEAGEAEVGQRVDVDVFGIAETFRARGEHPPARLRAPGSWVTRLHHAGASPSTYDERP